MRLNRYPPTLLLAEAVLENSKLYGEVLEEKGPGMAVPKYFLLQGLHKTAEATVWNKCTKH